MKGNPVTFEVDMGAAVTIMSQDNFWHNFMSEQMSESTLQLKTYTKDELPVIREIKVPVSYNNQGCNFIVKGKRPNL